MENIKPKTYEISELILYVKYFQEQNYTPKDAIKRWAMENYEPFYTGIYGEPCLRFYGAEYHYKSWKIQKNNDDTETVIITLKRVEE